MRGREGERKGGREGGREEGREKGREGGHMWLTFIYLYTYGCVHPHNSLVKGREHFSAIRVYFHCPVHHSPQEGGKVVEVRVLGTFREL